MVCYVWSALAGLISGALAFVLSPSLHAIIALVVLLLAVVDITRQGQGRGNTGTVLTLVALGLVALSWLVYWPAAFVGWLYSTTPQLKQSRSPSPPRSRSFTGSRPHEAFSPPSLSC